jgi:hypothetical protein
MAATPFAGYAATMAHAAPTTWLADALAPLGNAFGERLRFAREGSVARWSYDDHAAIVELGGADRILARFVAPAVLDAISGQFATPEYVGAEGGYALTRAGCERMVADMVDFFSGTREPRFRFVAAG